MSTEDDDEARVVGNLFQFDPGSGRVCAGCAASRAAAHNGCTTGQHYLNAFRLLDPRSKLTKNDVLNIEFPFTPEYNEVVTVQPDGFINLRQLPDLKVEGLTTPEVTEALKKAYAGTLHEPAITVTLQSFVSPFFIA